MAEGSRSSSLKIGAKRLKSRRGAGVAMALVLGALVIAGAVLGLVVTVDFSDDGSVTFEVSAEPDISVEVAGEVNMPGVYEFVGGDGRVSDLIVAAGGGTRYADLDQLNQAALLEDGQRIVVPVRCFNINALSAEEFDLFPGVGPATAQNIIEHRRANGPFATVENLTDVRGIGPTTLANIQDAVCLAVDDEGSVTAAPPTEPAAEPDIMVEVTGAVNMPGVYGFVSGVSRVNDLIMAAGGATQYADLDQLNLAEVLEDEERIVVPKRCFNINAISAEEFDLFPGIGPSRARDIVEHRRANGPFATVDNLTDVSGIGPTTLANIKDAVCLAVDGEGSGTVAPPTEPSAEPDISVEVPEHCFNINTISAEEFELFPGIGPSRAQDIVEHRRANGPFATVDNLINVSGIGPTTLANIKDAVCLAVDDEGSGTVAPPTEPSAEPDISVEVPEHCFNINALSAEEFERFPGIGPSKAQDIVEHRRANGPFATVDNLTDVSGIGPTTLANIKEAACLVVE